MEVRKWTDLWRDGRVWQEVTAVITSLCKNNLRLASVRALRRVTKAYGGMRTKKRAQAAPLCSTVPHQRAGLTYKP
jgi:hypothetical protein